MAIESIDIPLGTVMPKFELKDAAGAAFTSDKLYGEKGLLVIFTCNHCPYAKAVWPRTIAIAEMAKKLGVNSVGINPNIHPNYPEDAPAMMNERVKDWGISFPYLVDETQQVAKKYGAICTPDPFLFDKERKLVFHGRIDNAMKPEDKATEKTMITNIEKLLGGQKIAKDFDPSIGCSIKWKN